MPLCYAVQKSEAPDLSQDKRSRQEKPLDFLVQQAAVDSATKWRRVYQLGRWDALRLCWMARFLKIPELAEYW
jgi:hypothetical protein